MSAKAMSLKEKIKNYAKSNKIAAQVVLQNYMFERFLERLSVSEYSERRDVNSGHCRIGYQINHGFRYYFKKFTIDRRTDIDSTYFYM